MGIRTTGAAWLPVLCLALQACDESAAGSEDGGTTDSGTVVQEGGQEDAGTDAAPAADSGAGDAEPGEEDGSVDAGDVVAEDGGVDAETGPARGDVVGVCSQVNAETGEPTSCSEYYDSRDIPVGMMACESLSIAQFPNTWAASCPTAGRWKGCYGTDTSGMVGYYTRWSYVEVPTVDNPCGPAEQVIDP